MRKHRIVVLLFAATLVAGAVLAFTSAARAKDTIVKLVGAENGSSTRTPWSTGQP